MGLPVGLGDHAHLLRTGEAYSRLFWSGTERALVFNSGYAANTGVLPALLGKSDVVFATG